MTRVRALYNRDTLDLIRSMTAEGNGYHAIAARLSWTPEEVSRVAYRHNIALIADTSAKPVAMAGMTKAVTPPPPKTVRDRSYNGRRILVFGSDNPRNAYITVAVSAAAMKEIDAIAKVNGYVRGSVAGATLDYICRKGMLRKFFDKVLAEIDGAAWS